MIASLIHNPQTIIQIEASLPEKWPLAHFVEMEEIDYFRYSNFRLDEALSLERWLRNEGVKDITVQQAMSNLQYYCRKLSTFLKEKAWIHLVHNAELKETWFVDTDLGESIEKLSSEANVAKTTFWIKVQTVAMRDHKKLTQSQLLILWDLMSFPLVNYKRMTISRNKIEDLWIETMVLSKTKRFSLFFDSVMPSTLDFLRDKQVIEGGDGTPIGVEQLTTSESLEIQSLPVFTMRRIAKSVTADGIRKGLTFPRLNKMGNGIKYLFMLDVPLYQLNDLASNPKWPLLVSVFNQLEFFDTASLKLFLYNLGSEGVPKCTAAEAVAQTLWILKKTFPEVFVGERLEKVLFE